MGIIIMLCVILLIVFAIGAVVSLIGGIIFLCCPLKGKHYNRVNGFVENILVPRDGKTHYKYVFNYMANQQICRGFLIMNNSKLNRGDKFPLFYNKSNPSQIKSAKRSMVFTILGICCLLFIPVCLGVVFYTGNALYELFTLPY